MSSKFLYMKFLGLFMVVIGFSYCLTSFYNFFDAIFGNIVSASSNLLVTSLGLIYPLYIFIYGIFFYFYADICNDKSSKLILLSIILLSVFSILKILFDIFSISEIFDFVHISLAYLTLIIVIMNVYGSIKYKY